MSEQIVQKLITLLSYKVDNREQKKYDKSLTDSQRKSTQSAKKSADKIISENKRGNDKKVAQDEKAAERQKKIAEKVVQSEIKAKERLARQREKDYNRQWKDAEKDAQIRERTLQAEHRARARLEQSKQRQADKDLANTQRNATRQQQILDRQLANEQRAREKAAQLSQRLAAKTAQQEQKAREKAIRDQLKQIEDLRRAEEKAKNDALIKGYSMQSTGRNIQGAGKTGMNLFGGLIGSSATVSGDIEALLNQVQAHGDFNKPGERQEVAKLSKTISLSSAFNQMEILTGMKELGKAGYKGDSLKSLVKDLPSFATASDSTFDQATRLTTDMMATFGYKIKDAVKVMDLLTTGLNESKLDFSDLQIALKYAAPAWKASGGTLEDLMAVLAIQSQSGVKGSTAGTGNRTAAVNLALGMQEMKQDTNKKKQKTTATSLGINLYNEKGNFDYLSVAQQLAEKTKKMTKAQKTSTLYDIFGKTGMNQAFLVMDSFADPNKRQANADIADKVKNKSQGRTHSVAGIINKGYNFQEKQFDNSMMNLNEAIGKNLLPTFTELFDIAAKFFNNLSENNPVLLAVTAGFLLAGFAVSTLVAGMGSLLIFAGAVTVAMVVLGVTLSGIIIWVIGIGVAIAGLTAVVFQFITNGKNGFTDFANSVNSIIQKLTGIDIPKFFDNLLVVLRSPLAFLKSMLISAFTFPIASDLKWLLNKIGSLGGMALNINAPNITPSTSPLGGVTNSKSLIQNNNHNINIQSNGSHSNPDKIGRAVGREVFSSSRKGWAQMSGVYQ